MKKNIKQGTLAWEKLRETRIGSSEVFDIIRYYATDEELQNCGFNAEEFKAEQPFVSTWALYHKMLGDGLFQRSLLAPEYADYGHAMELYGHKIFQEKRNSKVKRGEVYLQGTNLIASLDLSGVSEDIDERRYDYGTGFCHAGLKFIAEQKTLTPYKNKLPIKYVVQAQYQIMIANADFFILQTMVLDNDTPFERGKIYGLYLSSRKKFLSYCAQHVIETRIYFNNNIALGELIKTCLKRFFTAVETLDEPTPYLATDKQTHILASIHANTFYCKDLEQDYDLTAYALAKKAVSDAETIKDAETQKLVEFAMKNHCSKFISHDGSRVIFSSNGRLLYRKPKEIACD